MAKRGKHPYERRTVIEEGGGSVTFQTDYSFPEDDQKRAESIYSAIPVGDKADRPKKDLKPYAWREVTSLSGKIVGTAQVFNYRPTQGEVRNWTFWRKVWNQFDKSDPIAYDPFVHWRSFERILE